MAKNILHDQILLPGRHRQEFAGYPHTETAANRNSAAQADANQQRIGQRRDCQSYTKEGIGTQEGEEFRRVAQTKGAAYIGAESAAGKVNNCAVLRGSFRENIDRICKFERGGESKRNSDMIAPLDSRQPGWAFQGEQRFAAYRNIRRAGNGVQNLRLQAKNGVVTCHGKA